MFHQLLTANPFSIYKCVKCFQRPTGVVMTEKQKTDRGFGIDFIFLTKQMNFLKNYIIIIKHTSSQGWNSCFLTFFSFRKLQLKLLQKKKKKKEGN